MLQFPKKLLLFAAILFVLPAFAQKNKIKNDSIARRDSIREFMFQGALLSMDALQAKYESQKKTDPGQKQQKAGESQNLFFQSRAYYRKALMFDKNYFPAWSNMGTTYFMQDLPKAAIPCYKKAIQLNPEYSPAWFNLGKAYLMIGNVDSAIYSYRSCMRTDSSYVQAYQEMSNIIMSGSKDTSVALFYLRLATKNKTNSDVPWESMAEIYFSVNDSAKGITALENAVNVYHGDLDRLQLLSDYFRNHNDPKKADYYSAMLVAEKKKLDFSTQPEK
jgi:tetratricopeptide (TPR) repeat protein